MRFASLTLLAFFCTGSQAESLPLREPIDLGMGLGTVVKEVKRDAAQSLFKIVRSYDYKADPSIAWGTPQSWFLICALRDVAIERESSQFTMKFAVMEANGLRPMENDKFADVAADRLYLVVDWLHGESNDVVALHAQGIVSVSERLAVFCAEIKQGGKIRK